MRLLESIFRLTRSNYYRVYLVDDCSPNASYIERIQQNAAKNAARLRHPNVVTTHRTEAQLGFGGACQAGYALGDSPYVCFVQSDCEIRDAGWLRGLGETLLAKAADGVRVVAPTTDNPVGGDPAQRGEPFTRSTEDVVLADDSYLTLYCFMCARGLFPAIGGFLKCYPYGGYEDQEFAHRLRAHGFRQAVCRSSWVHHEGEATLRAAMRNNPAAVTAVAANRDRAIADMRSGAAAK